MAINDTQAPMTDDRINDLYWNSSRTIDEIVEENGIGRSTLYASIVPLSLGAVCRMCGGLMVFPNRMSRASGTSSCEACGLTAQLGNGDGTDEAAQGSFDARIGASAGARSRGRMRPVISLLAWERVALIGGAAALGVMIGSTAIRAIR